jgi:hypothetical protein
MHRDDQIVQSLTSKTTLRMATVSQMAPSAAIVPAARPSALAASA